MGRNNRTRLDEAVQAAQQTAQVERVEAAESTAIPSVGLEHIAVVVTDCATPQQMVDRVSEVLKNHPGGTEQERCEFVAEAWRSWILAHGLARECPSYVLSADSDRGMSLLVQLSHAAHGTDPALYKELREKVREFELWREGVR